MKTFLVKPKFTVMIVDESESEEISEDETSIHMKSNESHKNVVVPPIQYGGKEKRQKPESKKTESKKTKKKSKETEESDENPQKSAKNDEENDVENDVKKPVHFPPKTEIKEDVCYMKKVPIDFHYELEAKPRNLTQQWLVMKTDKTVVQKKTKNQIEKEVWIQKSEITRPSYEADVMNNLGYLADKSAKELCEEILNEPREFRFLELSKSEKTKIKNKIEKYDNVTDPNFNFVEIIRYDSQNPFTGIFPYISVGKN